MSNTRKYDLEDGLIKFAVRMITVSEMLPNSRAGNHVAGQLVRCGTSPAFNYGEVQGAESQRDFRHKMRVILKELRETRICLRIIQLKPLIKPPQSLDSDVAECNELISIFVKSIDTAKRRQKP